jgi:hypothetical protein
MGRPLRGGTQSDEHLGTILTPPAGGGTPAHHNEMSTPIIQKEKTHTFYFVDEYRDNDRVVKLDPTEVEQHMQKLRDKGK